MTLDCSSIGFNPVPAEAPRDRLCRLVRHCDGWSLQNNREKLAALVARGVDPAGSRAVEWSTNCGTSALGILAFTAGNPDAAWLVHPLLQTASVIGQAIIWLTKIGTDREAWVSWSATSRQPKAGDLLFYAIYGVDEDGKTTVNEHVEWLLSSPDADARAGHGGGGRAHNAMTVEVGDIRTSAGRPLKRFLDLDKLGFQTLTVEGAGSVGVPGGGEGALGRRSGAAARTVFIDPGHGGHGPAGRSTPAGLTGAAGTKEKDLTLSLAHAVARRLPGAQLTRASDTNLSLGQRADLAREHGAVAFVSLHLGGPCRAWVHERGGASSVALAEALGRGLGGRAGAPVGRAELAVLTPERHAPSTAACLLEVDDLSDPAAEQRLRGPGAIDALADRIAGAIGAFTRLGGRGRGLPNLCFGPPGPGGRPLGAVTWNNQTAIARVPALITWRAVNDADTDAGSYSDRITIEDESGVLLVDELRRRSGLAADASADDSILFTPPGPGTYRACVRLNAGQMPIPEESIDDNQSDAAMRVWPAATSPGAVPLSVRPTVGAPTDDPALAAAIESELRAQLQSEGICQALIQAADGLRLPEGSPEMIAGVAARALQDAAPPRPGTAGDLIRAIVLFPPLKLTLDRLGEDTVQRFRRLTLGEQTLVFTWLTPIATGTIVGILRDPSTWPTAQSILNSGLNAGLHRFTPDLSVNLNLIGPNPSVMFTFDLAPTLRRAGIRF